MLTDAEAKAKKNSLVVYKQHYGPGYAVTRPKTKKKKRSFDAVFPSGFDDGKGAQRLMQTYVEESLSAEQPKQHVTIDWSTITDDFKSCNFLEQVQHLEMKNIPLLSQIAKQKALLPVHTTDKKKRLIDLADRLKRDDSNLVRIRLDNEGVDDITLIHLTLALPKNTHLQHLMLHNNAITDEGVNMLCLALRWHPSFHCLWIGANRFTDIGAKHFSTLLHRNPRIKELNLSNKWPVNFWQTTEIELHPHITYIGAEYLSSQLMKGCGLTRLSLADQRIRDDGAIHMFNVLGHCELRSLNISGNELTDRCCSVLGSVLSANPCLQMLSLSHNAIADEGAKAIAKGLTRNTELQALDLSSNSIDSEGMEALFLCLRHNQTIKTLVTVNNISSDPRAEDIAAARNRDYNVFRYGNRPYTSEEEYHTEGHYHNHSRTRDANFHNHMRDLFVSAEERDYFYQGEGPDFGQLVDSDHYNDYSRLDNIMSRGGARSRAGRQSISGGGGGGVGLQRIGTANSGSTSREGLTSPWRRPSVDLQIEPVNVGVLGKSVLSRSYRNLFEDGRGGSPERTGTASRRGSALGQTFHSRASLSSSGAVVSRPFTASSSEAEDTAAIASAVKRVTNTFPAAAGGSPTPSVASSTVRGNTPAGSKRRSFIATLQSLSAAPPDAPSAGNNSNNTLNNSKTSISVSEKKKPYRNSFQGTADTGRLNTPNFPPAEVHSLAHVKKSRDLGKTIGIPDIKNIGILPVRTSISSDKDSTQHFLYLRVVTTADDANDRPTSILQIGRDRENEIKKLKASRQTAQYKAVSSLVDYVCVVSCANVIIVVQDKKYLLETVSKVVVHKAAEPKVPDKFWDDWRIKVSPLVVTINVDNHPFNHQNRLQYIDGIDNSDGCTSTLLEVPGGRKAKHRHKMKRNNKRAPLPAIAAAPSTAESEYVSPYDLIMVKQDPKLAYQRHLPAKKANATPGEILAARRKEITIKKMESKQRLLSSDDIN